MCTTEPLCLLDADICFAMSLMKFWGVISLTPFSYKPWILLHDFASHGNFWGCTHPIAAELIIWVLGMNWRRGVNRSFTFYYTSLCYMGKIKQTQIS